MIIITNVVPIFASALLAAAMLASIKIGAQSIFRSAESRWGASGAIAIIFAWVIAFPIMVLLSLLHGIYLFFSVKDFHFIRN